VLAANRDGIGNPQDILAAAQADYGRIVGALYEQGYYGPTVSILIDRREAANIPPLSQLDTVGRVDLIVTPGPAFNLGRADIAPLPQGTEIAPEFRTGAPARTSAIRDAALAGVDSWRAIGHAKAQIDQQQIVADHAQSDLDVSLRIAPGPRVTFGNLIVETESRVREERIRQIAGLRAGEPFDPKALERAAARLRRAGSFASVSLREADALGPDDSMDVELALVDAKRRRLGFGAELVSDEGLNISAYWLHRNLLGGAERLRVDAEVGGLGGATGGPDYNLSARLTRPSTFGTKTDLYVMGELERLDEPNFVSNQVSIGAGAIRYFSEQLTAEAGLVYRFSDVQDGLGSRTFSHLTLPIRATWDRRDDTLNPTKGTYLDADIMPFLGFGDSASGGRGYVDARAYRGLGQDNGVVFAGRLQFGTVLGSSIADTPPDLLFFSGGSGTVRGQSYQNLSVTTAGVETGGRSFVGLSGEARVKITDTISAVGFYDMGYIGPNSFIDDAGEWHSGAGIGLRYQTGIGPIRFDVATPVSGPNGSGVQVYIGIGQAF
jgi:translocation and assembly module TamA